MQKIDKKKIVYDHSMLKLWAIKFWKIQGLRFLIWVIGWFVASVILINILNLCFTGSIEMSILAYKIQSYFLSFMIIWLIIGWIATIGSNEYIFEKYWNIVNKKSIIITSILWILLIGWINARDNSYQECKIEAEVCFYSNTFLYWQECWNNNTWRLDNHKCKNIIMDCNRKETQCNLKKPLWYYF